MDHSHARSANAFTVSREEYSRSPGGLSFHFGGAKPRKKGPMRPSMELRHRQLDLSLLQVRPPLCMAPALAALRSNPGEVIGDAAYSSASDFKCKIPCFKIRKTRSSELMD